MSRYVLIVLLQVLAATPGRTQLVAPGEKVERLRGGFDFLEGPATDRDGNVYFSDPRQQTTWKWSVDGEITLVRENTNMANGHYFDRNGNLLACETLGRRVISIAPDMKTIISVANQIDGKKFNNTNDLWIDPDGGIYFSDPRYIADAGDPEIDGEHVYYVNPDRTAVRLAADEFTRPNGLIGTDDGKTLYVADLGARKTFRFSIEDDGRLADRQLFCEQGSDGMTLDENGNVYLTGIAPADGERRGSAGVSVFNPDGRLIETIEMPTVKVEGGRRDAAVSRQESPANMTFGDRDHRTLFICARTGFYAVKMTVRGHKTQFEFVK